MTPLLKKFLKAGWIQVGEGIPVFFRLTKDKRFPFEAIVCTDSHAYFDQYNEWVYKKVMKEKDLNVSKIVGSGFTKYCIPFEMFNKAIIELIAEHYFWNNRSLSSKGSIIPFYKQYQKVAKSL